MKLFKIIFLALFVISLNVQAQSKDEIYNNALEEYLDGNYQKALQIIESSQETDIYISSLKAQIEQKLGKTPTQPTQVSPKEEPQVKTQQQSSQTTNVNVEPKKETQVEGGIKPQQSPQTTQPQSISSDNNQELYFQALDLFQSGSYNEALQTLNKVNSAEIDTEPLRQQILAKLGAKTSTEEKSPITNKELYFKAVELFQNAEYKQSLEVLNKIKSDEIDTKPLRKQILAKLEEKNTSQKNKKGEGKKIGEPGKGKVVILPVVVPDTINIPDTTQVAAKDTSTVIDITPPQHDNNNLLLIVVVSILFLVFVGMLISLILINKDKKRKRTVKAPDIIIKNSENGKVYKFNKSEILIGKEDNNDIVLRGNGISRQHAGIFYNEQRNIFNIKDLDSKNGTLLNGKRVKVAPLSNGDKIKVFKSLLIIKLK